MREGFWACCTFPGAKFHSLGSALGRQQTKAHPGSIGTVKVTFSVAGVCRSRHNPQITALIPGGLFVGPGIIVAVTRNFKDVELLHSAHTWGVNRSPHQGWGGSGLWESGRMSFEPQGGWEEESGSIQGAGRHLCLLGTGSRLRSHHRL